MNLVFLGPPGAGKGTMASLVRRDFHIPHISTGELFRVAIKQKSTLGLKVQGLIEKGNLVPDDLTISMVKERLKEQDAQKGFILDGFPRTTAQAEALSEFSSITKVINLTSTRGVIIRRLSGRRVCRNCGAIYHTAFMPPKKENVCDRCGGDLYTRKDDTEESVINRLEVYEKETEPLINYYSQRNLLQNIDGERSADTVYLEVKAYLEELISQSD